MSILDYMVACVAMFHDVWLSVSLCNYHVNLLVLEQKPFVESIIVWKLLSAHVILTWLFNKRYV